MLAGRYSSGGLVVPQNLTKFKTLDGKIENEEFVVQVRNIALSEIRKNLLEKHNNFSEYKKIRTTKTSPKKKLLESWKE